MEILSKYYKSLKQASDYLDNIKQIYDRQVEAYKVFNERLDILSESKDEKLNECKDDLKKNKIRMIVRLILTFLLDNALFCSVVALINALFTLGIPLFIPIMMAVFCFMLHSSKKISSLVNISDMKHKIEEAAILLGENKEMSSLVELIQELEVNIGANEKFMEDFKQAIDEYMSLLLEQENKLLPYGEQVSLENEIQILEEGLKKLNLSYREEDRV